MPVGGAPPTEDMFCVTCTSTCTRPRYRHAAALTSTPLYPSHSTQAAAVAGARLPLPGPPSTSDSRELSLVVALDLSYGGDAVREAYERNVPTVSLLNAHSDTSLVTYPVYASEAHAGYQHFFLDWLLRVVNVSAGR